MRAERFIELKEYGTILIRVFEIKPLNGFDVDLVLNTVEEVVGDDYEAQYEAGVSHDYSDDWYCIDVDKVVDKFKEFKETTDDETYTQDRIDECLVFLKDFEVFTIYNTNEQEVKKQDGV